MAALRRAPLLPLLLAAALAAAAVADGTDAEPAIAAAAPTAKEEEAAKATTGLEAFAGPMLNEVWRPLRGGPSSSSVEVVADGAAGEAKATPLAEVDIAKATGLYGGYGSGAAAPPPPGYGGYGGYGRPAAPATTGTSLGRSVLLLGLLVVVVAVGCLCVGCSALAACCGGLPPGMECLLPLCCLLPMFGGGYGGGYGRPAYGGYPGGGYPGGGFGGYPGGGFGGGYGGGYGDPTPYGPGAMAAAGGAGFLGGLVAAEMMDGDGGMYPQQGGWGW